MKITYDHLADALYIELTDHPAIKAKHVSGNFIVDTDEAGEVIGIEILSVRKSGIDPLSIEIEHVTTDQVAERPDPEEISKGREAKREALARMEKTSHPK